MGARDSADLRVGNANAFLGLHLKSAPRDGRGHRRVQTIVARRCVPKTRVGRGIQSGRVQENCNLYGSYSFRRSPIPISSADVLREFESGTTD